jgi:chromate reductase, NAD(P)H dehydrogenase (quinone)
MKVLLISGSTRTGSANTAALVTAAALAPRGVTATLYHGLAALPAFNPDHDGEFVPEPVAELRREIEGTDAVLFCTPEYAGTLPGSLKNLLDWTVGGGELYGKPGAWVNVAAANRGHGAQQTLATVLGYVGATVIEPACRRIPVDQPRPPCMRGAGACRRAAAPGSSAILRAGHARYAGQDLAVTGNMSQAGSR